MPGTDRKCPEVFRDTAGVRFYGFGSGIAMDRRWVTESAKTVNGFERNPLKPGGPPPVAIDQKPRGSNTFHWADPPGKWLNAGHSGPQWSFHSAPLFQFK